MKKKAQHVAAKVKVPVKVSTEAKHVVEEKEYIKWAAIKTINTAVCTEKIFTGYCHSNIRDTIQAYNEDGSHFKEVDAGFMTNRGKFVNRTDAHEIAFDKCGYLESWMLYDDPRYGNE